MGHTPYVLDQQAQDLLFRQARTANTFTDEPVTDEHIQALYDLIKWAPTSYNQQPLHVTLVRSEQARTRLISHLSPANQTKTSKAPLVAIFSANTHFTEHLPTVFPPIPTLAATVFTDPDFTERSARFNATLQVAYCIVGIRAIGLAAGPMSGFDPDGVDKEFFPDGQYKSLVIMNIGKPGPDAWFERLPRLDFEQVVTTI